MYKMSKFNMILRKTSSTIIYNPITKMIVEVEGEKRDELDKLINLEKIDRSLTNTLKGFQMIVDKDLDEHDKIKAVSTMNRFNTQRLTLVVAPTLDCNFRCPYCFEKNTHKNKMSNEVAQNLVNFTKKRSQNIVDFNVVWYGGEPLLELDRIRDLTKQFKNNCSPSTKYDALIITNGYLLNKENAILLKELDISTAQITIDGPKKCHDKRRVGPNAKTTYDTILNNIREAAEHINVLVRVNVDKDNVADIYELFDEFEKYNLQEKIVLYIAQVYDIIGDNSIKCLPTSEFVQHKYNFMSEALRRGFTKSYSVESFNPDICTAATRNSYIIDPLGDIYKCYNTIGIKTESVGNVAYGPLINSNLIKWLNFEFGAEICKDCKMTLICGGGCPFRAFSNTEDNCENRELEFLRILDLGCEYFKSNIKHINIDNHLA